MIRMIRTLAVTLLALMFATGCTSERATEDGSINRFGEATNVEITKPSDFSSSHLSVVGPRNLKEPK